MVSKTAIPVTPKFTIRIITGLLPCTRKPWTHPSLISSHLPYKPKEAIKQEGKHVGATPTLNPPECSPHTEARPVAPRFTIRIITPCLPNSTTIAATNPQSNLPNPLPKLVKPCPNRAVARADLADQVTWAVSLLQAVGHTWIPTHDHSTNNRHTTSPLMQAGHVSRRAVECPA